MSYKRFNKQELLESAEDINTMLNTVADISLDIDRQISDAQSLSVAFSGTYNSKIEGNKNYLSAVPVHGWHFNKWGSSLFSIDKAPISLSPSQISTVLTDEKNLTGVLITGTLVLGTISRVPLDFIEIKTSGESYLVDLSTQTSGSIYNNVSFSGTEVFAIPKTDVGENISMVFNDTLVYQINAFSGDRGPSLPDTVIDFPIDLSKIGNRFRISIDSIGSSIVGTAPIIQIVLDNGTIFPIKYYQGNLSLSSIPISVNPIVTIDSVTIPIITSAGKATFRFTISGTDNKRYYKIRTETL